MVSCVQGQYCIVGILDCMLDTYTNFAVHATAMFKAVPCLLCVPCADQLLLHCSQEMLDTEQFMPPALRNAIRDAKGNFAREWTARHAVHALNRNQYLASALTLRGDINSTNVDRARNFEQGSLADRQADLKRRRSAFPSHCCGMHNTAHCQCNLSGMHVEHLVYVCQQIESP